MIFKRGQLSGSPFFSHKHPLLLLSRDICCNETIEMPTRNLRYLTVFICIEEIPWLGSVDTVALYRCNLCRTGSLATGTEVRRKENETKGDIGFRGGCSGTQHRVGHCPAWDKIRLVKRPSRFDRSPENAVGLSPLLRFGYDI